MTLINDLTTLVQALLQVTPPTEGANAEAAEKREHENKKQKNEKKEKVAVGLAVACETLKPKGLAYYFYLHSSESQSKSERKCYAPLFSLNTSSEISFGGTCLYVCAETLSHESPFPKTPRTGSNERAISAASCAAGGANSTNSNKLDSENVNAARIKFSQRCIALNT